MPVKSRPYPWDLIAWGSGLMLEAASDKGGLLWSEERIPDLLPPVQLTEIDRAYAQYPPSVEYPYAINDFSDGYGIHTQGVEHRKRYWYAEYADCVTGSPVCGPAMTARTLTASTTALPITQFIEFNGIFYFAQGRYLCKVTTTSSAPTGTSLVTDFGAGVVIGQMHVFKGTQSAAFLFIPLGSSTNYQVMSTAEAFTASTGADPANQKAMNFKVVGRDIWLTNLENNQYVIRKSPTGGTLAVWGAPTIIGDSTYPINWLVAASDRLYAIKTDAIFAPTSNGPDELIDQDLAPSLRQYAMTGNGVNAINWNEDVVFPFGNGLWNYSPFSGVLKQFGPELLEENLSPIKGVIRAVAGQAGIAIWAGLYDTTAGTSFLVRFGAWDQVTGTAGPARIFKPAWHGHYYKWTSKRVTSMEVTHLYTINTIANQPHLFTGFADGTIGHCILSRQVSALDDPNYAFNTTNDGVVHPPRYHGNMPSDSKLLRAVGVYGHNLTTTRTLRPAYKLPVSTGYTNIGPVAVTLDPGDRVSLTTSQFANAFDTKITLHTGAATSTPVLEAFVVYSAVRSVPLKKIRATVRVANGVQDRQGKTGLKSWQDIRDVIEAIGASTSEIELINPAGELITVMCTGFGHSLVGYDKADGSPRFQAYLDLVQTSDPIVKGTWLRASSYTWGDVAGITWTAIAAI